VLLVVPEVEDRLVKRKKAQAGLRPLLGLRTSYRGGGRENSDEGGARMFPPHHGHRRASSWWPSASRRAPWFM